ncbi:MAG: hypothetical protein ACR2G6_14985, partial [Gemmatimonadaceae bacterium]
MLRLAHNPRTVKGVERAHALVAHKLVLRVRLDRFFATRRDYSRASRPAAPAAQEYAASVTNYQQKRSHGLIAVRCANTATNPSAIFRGVVR